MSIRHGMLALLSKGPRYGYQLRAEFESVTGATWPLNVGQVYATLSRLERDGLAIRIAGEPAAADPVAGNAGGGRSFYRITQDGVGEMDRWFATPLGRTDRSRDELAIKLALALTSPGVDVRGVVEAQRTATLHALRDLARLKADAVAEPVERPQDAAWRLVLDSMILQSEAELRWLDHCEEYLLSGAAAVPG